MTHDIFPVAHSTLSAQALLADVVAAYDLGDPRDCQLLERGMNDTYRVVTTSGTYALRVYRAGWRTRPEVQYEIDLLCHLHRKGIPVAVPCATRDGAPVRALRAPEGERLAVVFSYVPGRVPRMDEAHSRLYGRGAATLHAALDDFSSPHERTRLDVEELLERPLGALHRLLQHRPGDLAEVLRLADRLLDRARGLRRRGLEWGVCHGDLHGGNAHVTADGSLAFFDFDCAGEGWRAYDVAVFRWQAQLARKDEAVWRAFLEGYAAVRPLAHADLQTVPFFVAVRHVWFLGLHARNADQWGVGWLDERTLDRTLRFLRRRSEEALSPADLPG